MAGSSTIEGPTLLIKNVPVGLSDNAIWVLLNHYGAINTRPMNRHGKMKGCVFADFRDIQSANQAKDKINSIILADRKLKATNACKSMATSHDSAEEPQPGEKREQPSGRHPPAVISRNLGYFTILRVC